jgi:hypothetical protein
LASQFDVLQGGGSRGSVHKHIEQQSADALYNVAFVEAEDAAAASRTALAASIDERVMVISIRKFKAATWTPRRRAQPHGRQS